MYNLIVWDKESNILEEKSFELFLDCSDRIYHWVKVEGVICSVTKSGESQ